MRAARPKTAAIPAPGATRPAAALVVCWTGPAVVAEAVRVGETGVTGAVPLLYETMLAVPTETGETGETGTGTALVVTGATGLAGLTEALVYGVGTTGWVTVHGQLVMVRVVASETV